MTFKHVKFEDSAVMRSLEKLAQEKGLVDPRQAVVKKTASAPDLGFPQASTLMENVLRLCAGLRHAGFEKHALDIEQKFLAFKQADTIYETSKEKGEDLIDAAHPKGSHKLENVDGEEAVFETILDQHLKNLKMIEKTPTGKLAGADILKSVKIALADATTKLSAESFGQLKRLTDELDDKINSIALLPGSGTTDDTERKTDSLLSFIRSTLLANKVTSEAIDNTNKLIDDVLASIGRTFWTKETEIARMLNNMKNYVNNFIKPEHLELVAKKDEPKPVEESPFAKSLGQVKRLKEKLTSWLSYRAVARNQTASSWIREEIQSLEDIETRYSKVPETQQQASVNQLQKEISEELADINDFEQSWIRS